MMKYRSSQFFDAIQSETSHKNRFKVLIEVHNVECSRSLILEKMNSWSDTVGHDVESVYTKDQLLTNIMVYIVTRTFNTASWIYYGRREEGGRLLSPEGKRVEVPTGCALFPAELLAWPPRSYAERIYNVTQWTEMPRGGHFAAMEQPDLLIQDIRKFVRSIK